MWVGRFLFGYIPPCAMQGHTGAQVAAMAVALVKRVFQKHPFVSNCVVYGTLYVGAEFSQQTLSRKILSKKEPPEPYDIGSLARYAVVGSTVYPIMLHNWYLSRDCQSTLVQSSMSSEFEKYPREKQTLTVTPVGIRIVVEVATKLVFLVASNGNPRPYDMKAMARYGLLGLCFYPQVYYFWYKWLDKHYAGTAAKTVVKKLLLDQFLFTPPLIIAFYLIELLILASRPDNQLPVGPPSSTGCVCGIMRPHLGQHPLLVQTARLLKIPFPPQQQYRLPRRHRFFGERK
uniref:Uncharacterized protein n=1 Tax=Timema shepardi TaxID=629360 RepID=A0A7R9AKB9_TIMSH|nr:unnamed protein product [Timema shepardi]